jgi:signal transduction histidine kinase
LRTVEVDRTQVQQVLLNLIMNSFEAMRDTEPSPAKTVVVRTLNTNASTVEVAVRDNGPGIANDRLERIFEPFFTTKSHGLGLGLSICRTIIRAHGGNLEARNCVDHGATFRFTLPTAVSPR